jgi:hypothetical protein
MVTEADLAVVGSLFDIPGTFRSGGPLGRGHVHDTYVTVWEHGARLQRFVHQRINTDVFSDPELSAASIARVLEHLRRELAHVGEEELARRVLTLVPAREGGFLARAHDGAWWRTTVFIPRTRTLESVDRPEDAFEAARAFGDFLRLLSDLPEPRLPEVIPGFHDTPQRVATLVAAVDRDRHGRAAGARDEVGFALGREALANTLAAAQREGLLPERVVHNDTKINNVLFDESSGEALCVIDLDTVMPGTAPHDFGDLVRSAVSAAPEDERDLSLVEARLPVFEALVRGYLTGTAGSLVPAETERLVTAAKVVSLECGIRFLTDHLAGDTYFPAHRPGHNLDRARAQFALLRSLERAEPALDGIVAGALAAARRG